MRYMVWRNTPPLSQNSCRLKFPFLLKFEMNHEPFQKAVF